tara:strand:+ start:1244 stop:1759 length:516 start_codon:yes stop_codon:yes gene_type:complete
MFKGTINSLMLTFGLLGSCIIFQNKAYADYSFDASPSDVWSTETSDSVFELTASDDEVSCSSGGGSTPSLWIGSMAGNGQTDVNDYDGEDKTDEFLTGGFGFSIPLGRKANYNNCDRVLAIVEAEKFLQMVESLKDLEVIDQEKVKEIVNNYLVTTEKKLGIDLMSSLTSN